MLSYVVMKTTWIGFENIREAVVRQAQSACGMEGSVKNKRDRLFFTQLFVPQASQSSPYRRIQIRNLIRDSSDERNRLRNGDYNESSEIIPS